MHRGLCKHAFESSLHAANAALALTTGIPRLGVSMHNQSRGMLVAVESLAAEAVAVAAEAALGAPLS